MRVVVVSAWEPWRIGDGAVAVLHHQLRELAPRHDVTVLASGAPDLVSPVPDAAARLLPDVDVRWFGSPRPPRIDAARRRARSLRLGEPAHVGFVERPGLLAALDAAVATGVDLVHLHGWGTAGLWRRLPPTTPTLHVAVDPWTTNAGNRVSGAGRAVGEVGQRRLVTRHEARHYPRLGAVVVLTEHDADVVRATAPGARVEVVVNGVDLGAAPSPLPADPVLGFHGAFESRANVDAARHLVRDVLPGVRRGVPSARALLVGRRPGPQVRALVADAAGVELAADVTDLRAALSRMSVHVDWMTSGTGMKNKVLEAMAAGRPVVASALGAAGIGAGPGLVVAGDLDAAVREVTRLLNDPEAAAAVGRSGRERVRDDFSWAVSAARIEALWRELAAAG